MNSVALSTSSLRRGRSLGFTLIEILVTLSLIAILMAILIPSLRAVRGQSRSLKCQINMRSVAFESQAFLTPEVPMNRGDDESDPNLGGHRFWLETFQETQYRIDEFWDRSSQLVEGVTDDLGIMACPEVRGEVQLRSGRACRGGAVTPARHVSYAMNLRLDHAERKQGEFWTTEHVRLSDNILDMQLVPLIWDIDGQVADDRRITPHYSAPAGEPGAPYSGGNEWFPANGRHGHLQVAFTSGEVLSSTDPLHEASWKWTFNP